MTSISFSEIFSTLALYFSFPFVRRALFVAVGIALSSSLLGVTLVLKRFSFIGDGLSHVAFGAMAVATVLGFTNTNIVIMPVTMLAAIFLLKVPLSSKVKGDARVALLSVVSMALGYFLLNVFSKSANVSGDVCQTLFGSTAILTLTLPDVWICIVTSFVVVLIYVLNYHKIFAVTFDEDFALASGINVGFYNMMIALITAMVIVLAMNLVGSLLITALVVFPALSAMCVFKSFKRVIFCAAFTSVFCATLGIIFSVLYSTPVGATIVLCDGLCYIIFFVVGKLNRK